MPSNQKPHRPHSPAVRALIEVAFILFLFYANLLMGEFTRGNKAGKTIEFAFYDIFTLENLTIGLTSALIGYVVFEYLRKKT